ncbi:hypothetical protein F503_03052 [Ophiostoma piceae UAMH 11346]|uniref:Uncharacterized protein n=1 Tax=Ophiostoma piceae (strain UAMH 11346) TaxID=1262450 RepID=S3CIN0_OPHP1|nr:hypothetical protein F503_03052 [Ophiostoma piceae UAMH 11346]
MVRRTNAPPVPERESARLRAQTQQNETRPKKDTKRKEAPPNKRAPAKRAKSNKAGPRNKTRDQATVQAVEDATDKQTHDEPSKSADDDRRSQMLDSHTRSLLPGSWFGTADEIWARGLWSLDQENALRSELQASPQYERFKKQQAYFYAQQQPSGEHLEAELRLAEILQHRFRCNLDDLFRYGLKPDLRRGASRTNHHLYASKDYLVKLACILTHPIWNSISTVRWMLQRVVQERVPGHARPLVPPYSYWKQPFLSTVQQWATGAGSPGEAAEAAEAEMAWFLFSASMPRDLWMLDGMLEHDEPGYDNESDDDSGNENEMGNDDGNETDSSITSALSQDSRLSVCSAIKQGRFGALSGSFSDCEATLRQDRLRREDHLTARTRGLKRTSNVVPADMTDELVFFDLQEQDLDCMLELLGHRQFLASSGWAAPECYYAGYIKAHDLLGHGRVSRDAADNATGSAQGDPLLTCSTCAQEYHQGDRPAADQHVNKDGHAHFLHQQFVRGDPKRMLDWLRQRKLEWLAAGVREARINAALRAAENKESEEDGRGKLHQLPDVPPFDPVPTGYLDHVFTHPSQLEVMKRASLGDRPHASVLWCLEGQWDEN